MSRPLVDPSGVLRAKWSTSIRDVHMSNRRGAMRCLKGMDEQSKGGAGLCSAFCVDILLLAVSPCLAFVMTNQLHAQHT